MHCFIGKEADLFDIIGYESKVTGLSINGIHFGDANGNSKLEMSSDREFLKIYTEDNYIGVAKMNIEDIQKIEFWMDGQTIEMVQ